ncbi:SMI1/KNR4 family protein [Chryseobacterium oryctis]|uniref:SMI1/KNR4 family protein n=1 Tax=Chryseobacterium oryctis TaxID=2952618 RepID=A0ABT3HK57_9FLAO|nr:SMI1/KNR4 family protein [Chryseobacterium oryctis]MCW3160177.1 SMI1/KNR4 family protein [Chryseobacterium oryctis]
MNIVENYIQGLKNTYYKNNGIEIWEHFENIKHGASKENIETLKNIYPQIPKALLDLLDYVDGTYWREYAGEEIAFFLLGSDVYGYPYYFLSSKEMIENQNQALKYYSDYIERKYDDIVVDDKITNTTKDFKWLHFSDCMNNGGTSQLFIDFTPSKKGQKGQIIRFLHDPDEFKVIANNFEEYLQNIIDTEYNFINEENIE